MFNSIGSGVDMNLDKEINDLLLAINMEKIHLQTVITCTYRKKAKCLKNKYGLEFMKRKKVVDSKTGKNHYIMMAYRAEVYPNKLLLYKRLGEIYTNLK